MADTPTFTYTTACNTGIFQPSQTNISVLTGGVSLVTIRADGTIGYGPNYTPDAAAKAFWDAVGHRRALTEAAPDVLAALTALLENHCQLVMCGDCGNWDVETEKEVIAARLAIAKATGQQS